MKRAGCAYRHSCTCKKRLLDTLVLFLRRMSLSELIHSWCLFSIHHSSLLFTEIEDKSQLRVYIFFFCFSSVINCNGH